MCLGAVSLAAQKPNILLIIADDLGYGELSCQGNPQIPTPNIDSLALNGVRFTSGYVTAPFCAPSRAGLLTGRNQARFGYDLNPVGKRNLDPTLGLPLTERTLAELLKREGYVTGLIGKWHLGGTPAFHPQRRGFDKFYGFLHEGHYYAPIWTPGVTSFLRTNVLPQGVDLRWIEGNVTWSKHTPVNEPLYDAKNPVMRGTVPAEETEFLTEAWSRETEVFIRQHQQEPFFLELAYNAPHSPMQALDTHLRGFSDIADPHRRVFAGMVAHLDDSVGRILAILRKLGIEDRTLIIFLSDNGGPTAELTSSNSPLRGGKGQLFEGGIRVPFIMQWKDHLPAGRTYTAPVTSLDILPTVLAAAGASANSPASVDGVNLLPFLMDERQETPHELLFWRYGSNSAVRSGAWKLVKQSPSSEFQLYNLAVDIGETQELAADKPEIARRLRAQLEAWLAQLPSPLSPK